MFDKFLEFWLVPLIVIILISAPPTVFYFEHLRKQEVRDNAEFRPGQMVRIKISGRVAQILVIHTKNWSNLGPSYYVRTSSVQQTTDVHLLGRDGPIENQIYSKTLLYAFEFEPVENPID